MTRETVFTKLTTIFRDIFDDDSIELSDNTTAADIEDWDSLEHINLVLAIEKSFNMKFNIKEVGEMKNVGAMADLLLSRVKDNE